MKLARYATHRSKFIAFLGAFHGRTLGALSLTASKAVQRRGFGPLIPGVYHVPYPDTYRQGDAAARMSLEALDRLFHTVVPPEEVAAIFVEPVQGEGGYLVPPKGFLEDLARIAKEHGILLVFDEVQCGMGRTGKLWAWQHSGVAPDILTTAKGIASGLPLSAMIARADLMQWKPGAQASTFGGNPVAVAAALETLDLLEESLIDNAARVGAYMMERLATWPARIPSVGDVRGVGLMMAIEMVRNRETRERAPDLRDAVVERAFERGLLVLGAGENAIRLCPPLIITREQADFALDVLEEACVEALA
jgi:4-aminobutyrate aminotransferase